MTAGQSAFVQALLRRNRRRLRLDELRSLWRQADPIAAGAEDAHARFRNTLRALESAGVIALPVSMSAWDRSVSPALPRSVAVTAARSKERPALPATAWVPELAFAGSERHPATLEALQAINRWLKRNRAQFLPVVPIPERSLEIFGDEKRLDGLRNGEKLFGGRLCLADLSCRRVPPLLMWHPGRSVAPVILIVENAAAFESFRHFNEQAGAWRAVVWGAGNAFRRNHAGLAEVFTATGARDALYFGDLDPKGVEILAAVLRDRPGDLRPHRGLYAALTARGMVRRDPGLTNIPDSFGDDLRNLLPEVAATVLDLWRKGLVLPQEGYGTQALLTDPQSALCLG